LYGCSFWGCWCWLNCLPSTSKLSFYFYRYPNEVYKICSCNVLTAWHLMA
jgi:hypothetical protein